MKQYSYSVMPYTAMEFQDEETVRVWKVGSLEPDINTYAGIEGSDFHNGTIEVDVCGRLLPDAPDYSRGFIGIVFRAAEDGREFESFYIRPTNGKDCTDPVRKSHGCQYFFLSRIYVCLLQGIRDYGLRKPGRHYRPQRVEPHQGGHRRGSRIILCR